MNKGFIKILIVSALILLFNYNFIFAATKEEENFINLIKNINIETIKSDTKKSPALTMFKSNGFIFYKDNKGGVFTDLRYTPTTTTDNDKYAIAVNRTNSTVTVYKYNETEKSYNLPVVCFACSINKTRTPIGLYHTSDKYRWHEMFGDVYCQYCIRFFDHFLLHSPVYRNNNDSNSLVTHTYNGLLKGEQSSGCVRLRVGDAKWLYDNIKDNTPVYVYDSTTAGPLEKQIFPLINSSQTFDPTDLEYLENLDKSIKK